MFKKLIQFLLGEPQGYVSPEDKFLESVRHRYPKPSASQLKSQRELAEIRAPHGEKSRP